MKISKDDLKFIPGTPDPNFNEKKNKSIINQVIKDYESKRASVLKAFRNNVQGRAEAVASYLTSQHGAQSNNPVERYFGKRTLAELRGENIVSQIKKITQHGPKT